MFLIYLCLLFLFYILWFFFNLSAFTLQVLLRGNVEMLVKNVFWFQFEIFLSIYDHRLFFYTKAEKCEYVYMYLHTHTHTQMNDTFLHSLFCPKLILNCYVRIWDETSDSGQHAQNKLWGFISWSLFLLHFIPEK